MAGKNTPSEKNVARPHVTCHVLCSVDGRIDGSFMASPAAGPALRAYAELQRSFGADALLYGATTARGFAGAGAPRLDGAGADVPDGDYVAPHQEGSYLVCVDPAGEVGWQGATFRRAGRPDAHVVELLCEKTPRAYRSYLRRVGVSYVIAGEGALDLGLAVRRLGELFGMRELLVCGGGVTDCALLAAGVLDEVSLVVAPVVSGERGVATSFDASSFSAGGAHALRLARAERLDGDALHLTYRVAR